MNSNPYERRYVGLLAGVILACSTSGLGASDNNGVVSFHRDIEPILEEHCYRCHGLGSAKGKVAFDKFESDRSLLENRDLWWRVLKMVRSNLMPPANRPRPKADEIAKLESWIKRDVFKIDPENPDPGAVTLHRLNRIEYRNTIRDLLGVDFDTNVEFPPEDSAYGFDNIGDVLSVSPLLMEKYIAAARAIVAKAVPTVNAVPAQKSIPGNRFHTAGEEPPKIGGPLVLSYYKPAHVASSFRAEHGGRFELVLNMSANERYVDGQSDFNKCRLVLKVDGEKVLERTFVRGDGSPIHQEFERSWKPGEHRFELDLEPLTPGEKQIRSLNLRIYSLTLRGPMEKEWYVEPPGYKRFFPKPVPKSDDDRRFYARQLLRGFATRAFRRPVEEQTLERLVDAAEKVYAENGQTFEAGIAQAMILVFASPRFIFRMESVVPGKGSGHPLVDEYALASRLSYLLWSTMPDEELLRLAREGKLRKNQSAQVARMLADPRSVEFVRNFAGQWLQARDIETVVINTFAVITNDEPPDPQRRIRRERFRELSLKANLSEAEKRELEAIRTTFIAARNRFAQLELNGELRRAMRKETEMAFEYVVRKDRSLLELIDSDYTFLNNRLAKYYGIDGVDGDNMRLVNLPAGSPRGGVLTEGTVLASTSNPDRTSPVKRGLFVLDKILGMPPPPPPANVPPLEKSTESKKGQQPSLREALKMHRSEPLCNSCHNRMDPLGLAFENFNALGRWREKEHNQPIESSGELITGEKYGSVQELKHILVTRHHRDFYRCLTENLLTYALGRGLDYNDVQAVDEIVDRLEKTGGRANALLSGILESAPFQKRRALKDSPVAASAMREHSE
jgi:hypothetical protein